MSLKCGCAPPSTKQPVIIPPPPHCPTCYQLNIRTGQCVHLLCPEGQQFDPTKPTCCAVTPTPGLHMPLPPTPPGIDPAIWPSLLIALSQEAFCSSVSGANAGVTAAVLLNSYALSVGLPAISTPQNTAYLAALLLVNCSPTSFSLETIGGVGVNIIVGIGVFTSSYSNLLSWALSALGGVGYF